MECGDRCFDGERARPTAKRFLDKRKRFGDLPPIPPTAILVATVSKAASGGNGT
jgi:hypothetical protein